MSRSSKKGEEGDVDAVSPGSQIYVSVDERVYVVKVLDDDVAQAAYHDLSKEVMKMEAFLLKMKANGKELDPRFFSSAEARSFSGVGWQGAEGMAGQQRG